MRSEVKENREKITGFFRFFRGILEGEKAHRDKQYKRIQAAILIASCILFGVFYSAIIFSSAASLRQTVRPSIARVRSARDGKVGAMRMLLSAGSLP